MYFQHAPTTVPADSATEDLSDIFPGLFVPNPSYYVYKVPTKNSSECKAGKISTCSAQPCNATMNKKVCSKAPTKPCPTMKVSQNTSSSCRASETLLKSDLCEHEKEYVLQMEVPGVEKANIKMWLEGRQFTVQILSDPSTNEPVLKDKLSKPTTMVEDIPDSEASTVEDNVSLQSAPSISEVEESRKPTAWLLRERVCRTSVQRAFTLPENIDHEKDVTASLQNGVLTVLFYKKMMTAPRIINIA
jgi:HSP20 family molecular chaperone IbpA